VMYDAYKAQPYVEPEDPDDPTNPTESTYIDGPVMVVERVSMTTYEDKDTLKIKGFMNGKTTSVFVEPDEYAAKKDTYDKIQRGNVIIFSGTSVIKDCTVLLTSAEDNIKDAVVGAADGIVIENGEGEQKSDKVTVRFGEVFTKASAYFAFADEDSASDDSSEYVPSSDECRYILVEYAGSGMTTVKTANYSTLKESTTKRPVYVFIKTSRYSTEEVTDMIIFKGAENLE